MYDMDTHLWRYKWICGNITSFPEFSLKQIEELHEDYGRLLKEYGYTQYAYWYRMMRFGMTTYNKELAKEANDRLLKERKDDMADCKACVQHGFTCYAVFMDDYPLAMGYATPILEGKMKCREIPHYTYGELILPLYKAGELKKAAEMEQKGYRLIHDNIEYLGSMGNYLLYYSLRDTGKGIDRYQSHVHWSFDRFAFYNSRFCYAH